MRKLLCVMLCVSIFIAGCGGHAANPVDRYMPGDESKSCNALKAEIGQTDTEIMQKRKEINNRDVWNVVLFVGGFFTIVTWFFMDVKNSQEVEEDALNARKKALTNLYMDKKCGELEPVVSQ